MRYWGETWTHSRAKAAPPLQGDIWRVPEDWRASNGKKDGLIQAR